MVRRATWRRRLQRALAKHRSASGRTSDKGRSPSRSSAQGCAISRCLETRRCPEPRLLNVRHAAPKIQRERFRATETTTHTATTCGICSSRTRSAGRRLSTRLWQRKLLSGARRVADVPGAGHYGGWTGNLARDVCRAFLKDVDKPNVYWARIPCKDLAAGAAKTLTWCPFLLVHEVFASLV